MISRTIAAHLRRHVIGYLALFVAMGGVAFAATKAPKNSVVSKSIKNGQVKEKDLRDGAVSEGKLGDAAVTEGKLANGAVTEDKLGVPLDFVPTANVAKVEFSEGTCAADTDPGCTAHPPIPFGLDLTINCSNDGGDGVRLHMAVIKPGGRITGHMIRGNAVQSPDASTGNGAILNNVTLGNNLSESGSFISTFQTPDEQNTVAFTGNYSVDSNGSNVGSCVVDGVAVGE